MLNIATIDLEQQIISLSMRTVAISTFILVFFTLASVLLKNKKVFGRLKPFLFFPIASTLAIATIILFGATIYLNNKSESKGPVHWHADVEFWACGLELDLRNPTGSLSNKIGTSTYHEHNDKRIHLEGVVVRKSIDASLEKFMRVTGGYITDSSIGIPLGDEQSSWLAAGDQTDGDKQPTELERLLDPYIIQTPSGVVAEFSNGQNCGTQPAELQAFVYRYNDQDKTYTQQKLAEPPKYVIRDKSIVPPGDCLIIEFDKPKAKTDKLCRQYGVRDATRCVEFGVKAFDPGLCNIKEVDQFGGYQ